MRFKPFRLMFSTSKRIETGVLDLQSQVENEHCSKIRSPVCSYLGSAFQSQTWYTPLADRHHASYSKVILKVLYHLLTK